jgi:hypothetical protein
MFRERSPQGSLLQSEFLVPSAKAKRLERSWAEVFQERALPLIDEQRFAHLYCEDNGRPNRAVQTVLGVLLLKELFDLTDEDALEQLEFNLLWHHALRLTAEESHLPQKTLHNFRARLLAHDGGRLAFEETTDRIIAALGIRLGRQRLDSTHILSNMALLTRLGLFCETLRLFLRAVPRKRPELASRIPEGLVQRYLKEAGEATAYEDARAGDGRRRLAVAARDLYRLVERFRGTGVRNLAEYKVLRRLLQEQCHVGRHRDGRPEDDDDDAGEGKVPVAIKDPAEIPAGSLQSPHDPDATYSGHKGKGYEVQLAETCAAENVTQIITHVEVTPSSGSDAAVPVPVVDGLAKRQIQPDELYADTTYGSGRNTFELACRGTELVSPVAGPAPKGGEAPAQDEGDRRFTAADFHIDATEVEGTRCPAGHQASEEWTYTATPERVELYFARATCEPCSMRSLCPVKLHRQAGVYVLKADLVRVNIERRRQAEATREWRKRYAVRAGIEATNSELKRRHGLGRLRVRGGLRVRLAVYLKALACNLKRMISALQAQVGQAAVREPVAAGAAAA